MMVEAKPILIFMSTDWCQYCKVQKKQLRKNKKFKNKLDDFYYVEFDGESTDNIVFNNYIFQSNTKRNRKSTHDLVFALNNSENISFPNWVLLDNKYQVVFRYGGLLYPEQVHDLLTVVEQLKF
ncbi:thioredoxin family protein [Lutibacter sp. A80]|uniref:thioredoxin fold domain-containing protein n=1 Tax=Lutibacter sp. A80 TaxID=2918453 RepID=UPI001F06E912|nr:thioredoxin fold domain-containing protein [Lutibacter sp. A80]UMB61765.1 thioredoxin family protein [Lutibacter sp. A80]